MRRRWRTTLVAASAAAMLLVSGCNLLPGGLGGPAEEDDGDDPVVEPENQPGTGQDDVTEVEEAAGGDLDPLPVAAQQVGATVHMMGMEYTIEAMDVVDLDAEADRQMRIEGAEVVFTGSVVNPSSESRATNTGVALQWDDAAGGHSFEAAGQAATDPIPAGAASPVEFAISLNPEQLETFAQSTANLVVGRSGYNAAQIPLGNAGELLDRIPVPQADLIGQSFDIDGKVLVTVEEADLRWDTGDGPTEDGVAVLEMAVNLQNNAGGQQCWARGTGNNFALVGADGTGSTDLSMSDRGCTPSGDSTTSLTGILVQEDYAGNYTLTHSHRIEFDDFEDAVEFTMVDHPGVLLSER